MLLSCNSSYLWSYFDGLFLLSINSALICPYIMLFTLNSILPDINITIPNLFANIFVYFQHSFITLLKTSHAIIYLDFISFTHSLSLCLLIRQFNTLLCLLRLTSILCFPHFLLIIIFLFLLWLNWQNLLRSLFFQVWNLRILLILSLVFSFSSQVFNLYF